ncbi:SCO family protein [Exilibacterium tricleocarpae]|uniref:SCO family protein n=1 Tax=Exilibacterium tricleocarpae TaxID=2591008 RepID=UPI0015D373BE|nr:SCO family protein [Exilibacterium tricleocarpae]
MPSRFWISIGGFLSAAAIAIVAIVQAFPDPAPTLQFNLTTHNQHPMTERELVGRPTLLFLGFTACPHVCPTTLARLSRALESLDAQSRNVNVLFVTVDPHTDTPERMARYLKQFHQQIIGLSGPDRSLQQLYSRLRAYVKKLPGTTQGFNHSAYLYVFDADGTLSGHLSGSSSVETLSAQIQQLLSHHEETLHARLEYYPD